jgi:outer membrane protein OmpA-like peptidoglycan-associated protein
MRSRRWFPIVVGLGGMLVLPTLASADDEASQGGTAPSIQKDSSGMSLQTKAGESTTITVLPSSTTATKVNAEGKSTTETIRTPRGSQTRIVTSVAAPASGLPKLVPIYFKTDSAEIEPISLPLLDATAMALKGSPQVAVAVQGHADQRGSEEHNADLTERRALAVSDALQQRGVPASRLQASGYGAESPICSANNADCWSQNRRVDIVPQVAGG